MAIPSRCCTVGVGSSRLRTACKSKKPRSTGCWSGQGGRVDWRLCASKPAPTFGRVPTGYTRWNGERACSDEAGAGTAKIRKPSPTRASPTWPNFTLSIGLSKKSTTLKCIASITSGASASPDMMMIGSAARVGLAHLADQLQAIARRHAQVGDQQTDGAVGLQQIPRCLTTLGSHAANAVQPKDLRSSSRASLSSSTISTRCGGKSSSSITALSASRSASLRNIVIGHTVLNNSHPISQHIRQTSAEGRTMCTSSESLTSGRSTGFWTILI